MAYTRHNYKYKKQLIEDYKAGKQIKVYQPGPFGPDVSDGSIALEGPHYPEAHRWYASATVVSGIITEVE